MYLYLLLKNQIIADFGCGEGKIQSTCINHKVHAFDLFASNKNIVQCDISNVPLKDGAVDVVVFSLSLMGSNYIDYLKEGFRILKPFGLLFICEPSKKHQNKLEEFKSKLTDIGFTVMKTNIESKRFVYVDCMKQ